MIQLLDEQAQAFCADIEDAISVSDALAQFKIGMSRIADAHPMLKLDSQEFARHVAICVRPDAVMESLETLHWEDLWVVFGATQGSEEAWNTLETQYFSDTLFSLKRLKLTPDQLDEVAQHTRVRLFSPGPRGVAKLQQYKARGALTGWLKMVVMRDAIDMLSKKKVEIPAFGDDFWAALPAMQEDSEMALLRREYGAELKGIVEAVVADMDESERAVLRYHLVEGLSIDDIAIILGIHRATVARRINKARDKMAQTTRERMREHLKMSASQLVSVMRLIDTQLDLSLHRLL